jgi:hypothetical protein
MNTSTAHRGSASGWLHLQMPNQCRTSRLHDRTRPAERDSDRISQEAFAALLRPHRPAARITTCVRASVFTTGFICTPCHNLVEVDFTSALKRNRPSCGVRRNDPRWRERRRAASRYRSCRVTRPVYPDSPSRQAPQILAPDCRPVFKGDDSIQGC